MLGGSFSADAFFADAMTIVVGIEFVKMLMLHTPRAVTDVLLFAIARQLVVNHSSAVDTLLGVAPCPDLRHQEVSPHRRG